MSIAEKSVKSVKSMYGQVSFEQSNLRPLDCLPKEAKIRAKIWQTGQKMSSQNLHSVVVNCF